MTDERVPDFQIEDRVKPRGRPRKEPRSEAPTASAPRGNDRPPQIPKTRATATTAEVKQAMRTLESAYNAISLGMTILGLTQSATVWSEQAESLSKSNESTLTAAPKLAKAIASAGNTGGAGAFLLAHAMAIAPVVPLVRDELARSALAGRLAQRRQEAAEAPTTGGAPFPTAPPSPAPEAGPSYDPTLIPGTRGAGSRAA